MTDLQKKFLLDDVRRLSPSGRFAGLAAFGKHPGWDDHVEDLGLETDSLNHAKTVFYVNGIGGQIDSGAWEKLDATQQLPEFKHLFLWQRSGQILLGRLWSSSDGKGRKRYPMVVCLQFIGVSLRWALRHGLPVLAELEEQIQKTSSAEEVRSLLNRKRASLREALASGDAGGEYAPLSPDALHRILHPSGESNSQGFLRVLYQMESQFRTFAPGTFNPRGKTGAIRAQQIRLPSVGENPEQTLLFWTRFFLTQVDASVPLLICLPLDQNWVDVTAGDPESHEFFSLRASPKAVPLVSEVPYTLDDAFQSKARAFLSDFQRGESAVFPAAIEPVATGNGAAPAKGGFPKALVAVVIVILGAIGAVFYLAKNGKLPAVQALIEKAIPPAGGTSSPQNSTTGVSNSEPVKASPAPSEPASAPKQKEPAIPHAEAQPPKSAPVEKPVETVSLTKPAEPPPVRPAPTATTDKPASNNSQSAGTTGSRSDSPPPSAPAPVVAAAAPTPVIAAQKPASASTPDAAPLAGAQLTNSIGMIFVLMPSGFWAGKYEVTRAEFSRVMQATVSDSQNDRLPVNRVSWDDANEFCARLTQKESGGARARVYSLPTQSQWEEFRAGQKLEELPAGALKTSSQEPSTVAETAPNKLGLYGVLGNVWEWCLDGGTDAAKLQKGGEYNSASYDRLVTSGKARLNSGFRCVLVQK